MIVTVPLLVSEKTKDLNRKIKKKKKWRRKKRKTKSNNSRKVGSNLSFRSFLKKESWGRERRIKMGLLKVIWGKKRILCMTQSRKSTKKKKSIFRYKFEGETDESSEEDLKPPPIRTQSV